LLSRQKLPDFHFWKSSRYKDNHSNMSVGGDFMNRRGLVASLAASFGCLFIKTPEVNAADEPPFTTSLIRVIASPSAFDGRRLHLIGYVANNGLDRAVGIYLSEVDGRNFIACNSIDLRIDESDNKDLIDRYVTIVGTFH